MLTRPAATAHCRPLDEWVAHPQAVANGVFADALVAPPVRITSTGARKPPRQRHGSEGGALAGHRVLDISSFWAGPLAARLLAELGADVVKIEPPGGEGSYQLMAGLPNIYVDGNRSKRGMCLDLTDERDRQRFLDLVGAADVVVENAVAGTWERLNLHEAELRSHNPYLVYARAKGFGIHGPLASRPSFDYVVQAATGMIMTNGGGRPLPVNFTANDYCTGLHLAVGIVLGLLGRARGHAVTTVEASLMVTATVFQAEQVAELAASGHTDWRDLDGPSPGCHLYEAKDGWIVTCAVRPDQEKALCAALGVDSFAVAAIAAAVRPLSAADACAVLAAAGVPAAPSVHPRDVPDDPQVIGAGLLATVRHAVAGRIEQVGVPLRLSTDPPAVKGPAPVPARR
jgi:crotonobetainyl-CoA:carnitine CoA-transferase CaiB-like acyl-CoA transferase